MHIFDVLSQETRFAAWRVLLKKGKRGMAAGELSDRLGIPQNTLSFHLAQMHRAGLVRSRKKGRSIRYSIDRDAMHELLAFLLKECGGLSKSSRKSLRKLLG